MKRLWNKVIKWVSEWVSHWRWASTLSPLLSCRVVMGSITMWSRRYSYHFISLLLVSYLSNIHPSLVHFFLILLSTFLVLCPHVTSMIMKVESSEVVKARKEAERASNKPLYQQLAGTQSRLELLDYLPTHLHTHYHSFASFIMV